MRVLCRHGHFAFYPRDASEVSRFMSYFELSLVRAGSFYTFDEIALAKDYSLEGLAYLNLTATKTYEGGAWEVFKENNFVYDFNLKKLVLKTAIKSKVELPQVGHSYLSPVPLIQPGSLYSSGRGDRIMSYDAEFIQDSYQLRVREFGYE